MESLGDWLRRQPRGALTALWRNSGVSWHTVNRAKRGHKVGLKMAVLISRATRGEVPIAALTKEQDNVLDDEPRAAVA